MKRIIMLLMLVFVGIFLIGNVYAMGCDSSGWKGFSKLYENKSVCVTCPTCDYINISLTDPSGQLRLSNEQMLENNSIFCYEFDGDTLDNLGTYEIDGFSQLTVPLGLCFDVNLSGKIQSIWAYIIGILFSLLLFIGLIWLNIRFNYEEREKIYQKLVGEYFKIKSNNHRGNLAYAILYTIAYGILNMFFILYYLAILIILFIFNDMSASYGLNTFSSLMPQLISIMIKSLVILGVVFFAIFYKVIRNLLRSTTEMFRGVYENGR